MSSKTLNAAIVGAGFISEYHLDAIAKQPNVNLKAICDLREQAALKLARANGDCAVYTDLNEMMTAEDLDVVHVLTQPDSHFVIARTIIETGASVILEKPATTSLNEAEELAALAVEKGVTVAVNHNFVFSRPFRELKSKLDSGELGPLKSLRIVWKKKLPQAFFGPWNLWMLRHPANILFETGSHSISELLAVLGKPVDILRVDPRNPKKLPSGVTFYQRWNILAKLDDIFIEIDTAFDQGYDQHFVEVEGLFGVARADIENDYFSIDQSTGSAYDIERLKINRREGKKRVKDAARTYVAYAGSKVFSHWHGGPYDAGMLEGIFDCYKQVRGENARAETSLVFAADVASTVEQVIENSPLLNGTESTEEYSVDKIILPTIVPSATLDAEILIVGASGFIGKRLLKRLVSEGRRVRAIVRNPSSLINFEPAPNYEVMVGDFRDESFAKAALNGIKKVIHLAVVHDSSLKGYMENDSAPTVAFANWCAEAGIDRFIYTGTIDSLCLDKPVAIKESDGVDNQIKQRNNYAHSKAITERKLLELHSASEFPLVIVRPAIVLGVGGPADHIGIANWTGLGRCEFWGDGEHSLPLVFVDDVADGLCRAMDADGIEGKIYNLSSPSMISAKEYVEEVGKVLNAKIQTSKSTAFSHFLGDYCKWVIKFAVGHPDKVRRPSVHDWRCREQRASFDITAAKQDLGWQPVTDRETLVEKGIREPVKAYLNQ